MSTPIEYYMRSRAAAAAREKGDAELEKIIKDSCTTDIAEAVTDPAHSVAGKYAVESAIGRLQEKHDFGMDLRGKVMKHWGSDYMGEMLNVMMDVLFFGSLGDPGFDGLKADVELFDAYAGHPDIIKLHLSYMMDDDPVECSQIDHVNYSRLMVAAANFGDPTSFMQWFNNSYMQNSDIPYTLKETPEYLTKKLFDMTGWINGHRFERLITEALAGLYSSDGMNTELISESRIDGIKNKAIDAALDVLEAYKDHDRLYDIAHQFKLLAGEYDSVPNTVRRVAEMYLDLRGNENISQIIDIYNDMIQQDEEDIVSVSNSIRRLKDTPVFKNYLDELKKFELFNECMPRSVAGRKIYRDALRQ